MTLQLFVSLTNVEHNSKITHIFNFDCCSDHLGFRIQFLMLPFDIDD